jgi:hypothetical protein
MLGAVMVTAVYIHVFGVDVPHWDEWVIVDALRRRANGAYGWADLWSRHNEHRIVVPKLLFLAEYQLLGDHSPKLCMYVCLALLVGIAWGLCRIAVREHAVPPALRLWLCLPIVGFLVSPRQFENLMWGFQVGFVSVAVFAVACLGCLACFAEAAGGGRRAALLLASALFAALASLSSAMGLIVWWIGLPFLLVARKPRVPAALLWGLAAAATWAIHFHGFSNPPPSPSVASVVDRPVFALYFLLSTIGAPIAPIPALAAPCGLLLCGYTLAKALRAGRRTERETLFWLGLALFGVGTAATVTVGRLGLGIRQSLSSRYTTFTLLSVAGVYVLLLRDAVRAWRANQRSSAVVAAGCVAALVACVLVTGWAWGLHGGRSLRAWQRDALDAVLRFETATDAELQRAYPDADFCRLNAQYARQHGITPFQRTRRH